MRMGRFEEDRRSASKPGSQADAARTDGGGEWSGLDGIGSTGV